MGSGAVNGVIYVAGGYNTALGGHLTSFEAYNVVTNTWTSKSARPGIQTGPTAGVINGILYVAGGSDCCVNTQNLTAYSSASDTWTYKAAPSSSHGNSPAGGVINGQLYVAGGGNIDLTAPVQVLEVYDPATNVWTTKAPMPTPRLAVGGAVVNGIFYAVGGRRLPSGTIVGTVEAYDPTTNTWTTKAPLPTPRQFAAVGVLNGTIYAVGGSTSEGVATATVEAYDPATDIWTTQAPLPTARMNAEAVAVSGQLYVIGGSPDGATVLSTVEAFTPAPTNIAPVANAGGPYTGTEGTSVSLNGSASSDPRGAPLTYSWNFGDGSPAGSGATPSHAYADNGTYTVSLTVANPSGATNTATSTASIANVTPSVSPINGGTILKGETFTGSGSFADPGMDTWTATVNYGDGSGTSVLPLTGNTFQLSHVYQVGGTYSVTVTVTDDEGAAGVGQGTVIVQSVQQRTQVLAATIANLVTAGVLSPGNGNALSAKLQAAIGQLDRGNTSAATNQLNAFINQVNALMRAGRLPASSGQDLIDAAQRIITAISAP